MITECLGLWSAVDIAVRKTKYYMILCSRIVKTFSLGFMHKTKGLETTDSGYVKESQ